ncbi:hypothetical protein AtNW77_Chr4g0310891 [Arabidopsis thaliana]
MILPPDIPANPSLLLLSFVSPGVDKDRNWLSSLLDMMTCAQRFTEFQKYLQDLDTYPTAERESHLFKIGSALTTTKRISSTWLRTNTAHKLYVSSLDAALA